MPLCLGVQISIFILDKKSYEGILCVQMRDNCVLTYW